MTLKGYCEQYKFENQSADRAQLTCLGAASFMAEIPLNLGAEPEDLSRSLLSGKPVVTLGRFLHDSRANNLSRGESNTCSALCPSLA